MEDQTRRIEANRVEALRRKKARAQRVESTPRAQPEATNRPLTTAQVRLAAPRERVPSLAKMCECDKKVPGALFGGQKGGFWKRKVYTGPGEALECLPEALLRSVDTDFMRRIQP